MAIDFNSQKLVRLADVRKLPNLPLGRCGKRLHISTLYRWVLRGVRGVKLEVIMVGGSTCTSEEAVQEFFDEVTRRRQGGQVTVPPVPTYQWSARRRREIEEASRQLDEILGPRRNRRASATKVAAPPTPSPLAASSQ